MAGGIRSKERHQREKKNGSYGYCGTEHNRRLWSTNAGSVIGEQNNNHVRPTAAVTSTVEQNRVDDQRRPWRSEQQSRPTKGKVAPEQNRVADRLWAFIRGHWQARPWPQERLLERKRGVAVAATVRVTTAGSRGGDPVKRERRLLDGDPRLKMKEQSHDDEIDLVRQIYRRTKRRQRQKYIQAHDTMKELKARGRKFTHIIDVIGTLFIWSNRI